MKDGEVPIIDISERKLNDVNIAATLDLVFPAEAGCYHSSFVNSSFHVKYL